MNAILDAPIVDFQRVRDRDVARLKEFTRRATSRLEMIKHCICSSDLLLVEDIVCTMNTEMLQSIPLRARLCILKVVVDDVRTEIYAS